MAYYVLDANKNLKEGMDKEGIYAMLEQAIEDGDLEHVAADSAFVSKIRDLNGGQDFKVWIGTTAEYNAITTKEQNTLYLLTDDNLDQELTDIEQDVDTLQTSVDDLAAEHTTLANRIETVYQNARVQILTKDSITLTVGSSSWVDVGNFPVDRNVNDIVRVEITDKNKMTFYEGGKYQSSFNSSQTIKDFQLKNLDNIMAGSTPAIATGNIDLEFQTNSSTGKLQVRCSGYRQYTITLGNPITSQTNDYNNQSINFEYLKVIFK